TATVSGSGSGSWTFTTGPLTSATHSFTATDVDAAGNVSVASLAKTVIVDTIAPAAPIIVSDSIAANIVTVFGTAEANSSIKIYDVTTGSTLLGTATADALGAWSYVSGPLSDGSHDLVATATDAAGNTSAVS